MIIQSPKLVIDSFEILNYYASAGIIIGIIRISKTLPEAILQYRIINPELGITVRDWTETVYDYTKTANYVSISDASFGDACVIEFRLFSESCEDTEQESGSGSGSEDESGSGGQCSEVEALCYTMCPDGCTVTFGVPTYDSNGCFTGCDYGNATCEGAAPCSPDAEPPGSAEPVASTSVPNTYTRCQNKGYVLLLGDPGSQTLESIEYGGDYWNKAYYFDGNCYTGYFIITPDIQNGLGSLNWALINNTPINLLYWLSYEPVPDIYSPPPNSYSAGVLNANPDWLTTPFAAGGLGFVANGTVHIYFKPMDWWDVYFSG